MVFTKSLIAMAACLLSFTLASPPPPTTCCTDGQGDISQPGQGSTILPGQMIPFQYTPRNGATWVSHNITVELVIAEGVGQSMSAKAITNQVLAGNADYTWGIYSSGLPADIPQGEQAPPSSLMMPNLGFAPFNWGSVSDLQVYVAVLEEWTQYGSPDVLHRDVTYHWMTYNSDNNVQFECSGTVSRADQTPCECQFCSLPNMGVADNSTKLFSDVRLDENSCRDLCDMTKNCYTYTWNREGTQIGGNPDDSCVLYSASRPATVSSDSLVLGQVDIACKAGCYQATYSG